MKQNVLVALFGALLVFGPVASQAKTPDGMTPAEEVMCDPLADHTPGLYGLCVAYCEAQDLHLLEQAHKVPKRRLFEIYEKKRQAGDPPMPCRNDDPPPPEPEVACPCWTDAQRDSLVAATTATAACLELPNTNVFATDNSFLNGMSVTDDSTVQLCALIQNGSGVPLLLTPEEYGACYGDIAAVCADASP